MLRAESFTEAFDSMSQVSSSVGSGAFEGLSGGLTNLTSGLTSVAEELSPLPMPSLNPTSDESFKEEPTSDMADSFEKKASPLDNSASLEEEAKVLTSPPGSPVPDTLRGIITQRKSSGDAASSPEKAAVESPGMSTRDRRLEASPFPKFFVRSKDGDLQRRGESFFDINDSRS